MGDDDRLQHAADDTCAASMTPAWNDDRSSDADGQAEMRASERTDRVAPSTHARASAETPSTVFSCRRWYRLTGKSARPEDGFTHVLPPATRSSATAPPRGQRSRVSGSRSIKDSSAPRSPVSTAFNGRFDQHSVLHQYQPGVYGMESPVPSKWGTGPQYFAPQNMRELVNRAYATSSSATTPKRAKEQEKRALKNHIYLPAMHKTLQTSVFQSPRRGPRPDGGSATVSAEPTTLRLAVRPQRPAPIGANLLSSQLSTLRAELMQHRAASDALERSHDATTSSIWCPQPPHTSSNASYRSARYALASRSESSAADSPVSNTCESHGSCVSLASSEAGAAQSDASASATALTTPPSDIGSDTSLETHVLRILEGLDTHDSIESSSDTSANSLVRRAGDDNDDDDDDVTLLQAFEATVFNDQDTMNRVCSTSEIEVPVVVSSDAVGTPPDGRDDPAHDEEVMTGSSDHACDIEDSATLNDGAEATISQAQTDLCKHVERTDDGHDSTGILSASALSSASDLESDASPLACAASEDAAPEQVDTEATQVTDSDPTCADSTEEPTLAEDAIENESSEAGVTTDAAAPSTEVVFTKDADAEALSIHHDGAPTEAQATDEVLNSDPPSDRPSSDSSARATPELMDEGPVAVFDAAADAAPSVPSDTAASLDAHLVSATQPSEAAADVCEEECAIALSASAPASSSATDEELLTNAAAHVQIHNPEAESKSSDAPTSASPHFDSLADALAAPADDVAVLSSPDATSPETPPSQSSLDNSNQDASRQSRPSSRSSQSAAASDPPPASDYEADFEDGDDDDPHYDFDDDES